MSQDKGKLMVTLRERMSSVTPLPDEEDYHQDTETLMRFLKARDWNLDAAEKLLKESVEWRRNTQPMTLDCRWCHQRPGYHALRQVGHDEVGRPVMYSCFSQAAVHSNTVEDSVTHSTYLIENARRNMPPGVYTWVFVMDCTGMTLPACNPKLGYGVTQVMSNHYPERLGLVICVNHSPVFQGVWKAIRVFLHPNTASKMQMVRGKKKTREAFDQYFPEDLSSWLMDEMNINKQKPLPVSQREFWRKPASKNDHDPRGCPSYVSDHLDRFIERERANPKTAYRPHPNVVDDIKGTLKREEVVLQDEAASNSVRSGTPDNDSSDPEENGSLPDIELDEEFKIPQNASSLNM